MSRLLGLYESTLGKKLVMAVTGIVLFLFVLGHMVGNLQIYIGAERLNHYAELLQSNRALLWVVRSVLLLCVGVHILAAVQLWWRNWTSRPVRYRVFRPPSVDYAARTMVWSGPIIAVFVVYHLLHLTVGSAHGAFVRGDVYHNVVSAFQVAPVAIVYMLANFLLGVHLYHGLWSLFQTLGLDQPLIAGLRRPAAVVVAAVIALGNISIPLSVLAGFVR